jgi:hypothetical protein
LKGRSEATVRKAKADLVPTDANLAITEAGPIWWRLSGPHGPVRGREFCPAMPTALPG